MIKSGFRKQKRYAVDAAGDKQLVSTWTSTDTVYDGEGTDMTTLLATKTVPQATVADNGKTLRVIDGAWALDDCKVKQTQIIAPSSSAWYQVLFSGTAGGATLIEGVNKYSDFQYNPYDNAIRILGDVNSTTIKSRGLVLSGRGGSYTEIYNGTATIGYQGIDMTITGDDINLSDADSNNNTWDGTNTSLKTAITNKLDKSGGTMTGNITMSGCQLTASQPNVSAHIKSDEVQVSDSSGGSVRVQSDNVRVLRQGVSVTMSNTDIVTSLGNTWDGTHTSLKGALAAATNNDAVTQEDTSAGGLYRVLLSNTTNDTTYTGQVRKTSTLTYNPLTYDLTIGANSSTGGGTIKPNFNNTGTIGTEDNKFYSSYIQYMYGAGSTIKNGNTSYDYITEIGGASIWLKEVNKQTSTTTVGLTLSTGDAFLIGSTWDGTNTSLKTTLAGKLSKSGGTMTGSLKLDDGDANPCLNLCGGNLNLLTKNSSSDDSSDILFCYGDGSEKARIYIDTTMSSGVGPYYRCKSKGSDSYLFTGRLQVVSSSDIRLKENVKDTEVESALDVIDQIKMRSFDWKNTDKHQKIGFVADELEEIDEKFVDEGSGGVDKYGEINPKSVNTFYLIGYLTKAVQELSATCKAQQIEIDELKRL